MTNQKPTVVLVHGAFAESASWSGVVERLQDRSIDVAVITRCAACRVTPPTSAT